MSIPIDLIPQTPWYIEYAEFLLSIPIIWTIIRYREMFEVVALVLFVGVVVAVEKFAGS